MTDFLTLFKLSLLQFCARKHKITAYLNIYIAMHIIFIINIQN